MSEAEMREWTDEMEGKRYVEPFGFDQIVMLNEIGILKDELDGLRRKIEEMEGIVKAKGEKE